MSEINLNDSVNVTVSDADVVTVPVDATLTHSNEAADAAAVGAALALKADAASVVAITVNGQGPDNQGAILVDGTDIHMSSTDATTLKAAVEAAAGRTAADIPMSDAVGAKSVAEAVAEAAESTGDIFAEDVMMAEGSQVSVAAKISNMDIVASANSTDIAGLKARTANEIRMSSTDTTTVKQAVEGKVATVNGEGPDSNGNVQVAHAMTADNLTSAKSQQIADTFVRRASGDGAPIETGNAWLGILRGNRKHSGYSPESLTHSAIEAPREAGDEPLEYTINEAAFIAAVSGSSTTKVFTYTTDWSENLADYGMTAENAISGDQITVVYAAEARGTIVQSKPETFAATGSNLFDPDKGYAVGLKYMDPARFRIIGTYTAVKFSSTLTGTKTVITPVDGLFTINANGYIWVEGDAADLQDVTIYMTWTDWESVSDADPSIYTGYAESEIDMSALFDTEQEDCPFPYGLLQVADVRDEVNFNTGIATSRVNRMAYSAENIAAAEASGLPYEYDTNYIFIERAEYATFDLDEYGIDGAYQVDDHGLEFFTGTDVAVYAVTVYGNSLKNKLENDVLTISQQTLTAEQQGQVQENIGMTVVNNLTTTAEGSVLDARAGKTLNDKIAAIGTVVSDSTSGQNVNDSSWTKRASISITKGTWVIYGHAAYSAAFDAQASICLGSGSNDTTINETIVRGIGTGGGGAAVTYIYTASATTSICLKLYQASGSAKTTAYVLLRAVKVSA